MIIPSAQTKFSDFVGSLVTDFNANNTIPTNVKEENWREWVDTVATSPLFSTRGVPTSKSFSNWREWGIIMFDTMAR